MHSGEPRQEVRSGQGSCVCVCVHGCTQARGGQRTSTCTPCRCRTGRHAARTRSSCPCHADHPRSAACPSSAWLALNGVSYTQICSCSRRDRDSGGGLGLLWGCPFCGYRGRTALRRSVGLRPAPPHRPPQQPAAPGWFGESRCAAFPLAITISPLLVRATCQRRPVARRGLSSPFPDQLITLVLVVWSVAAWS